MKMIEKILPGFCLCRKVFPLLLCTLSFMLLQSCNTTEPPNNGNLSLSVEDVSSTEAWLHLKTENISLPTNVTLLKNNYAVQTISLGSNDTIIYVDSLLPNKTYTFQTSGIENQASGFQSNKVNVTTLDTSSHNFKFSTYTFGEQGAGSSYLNDVAIIDENNIWAVGAIYLKDSTGQPDPKPYNLARWNGTKWELRQVPFLSRGQSFNVPIYSIFVINENDIWLGIDQLIHWDGKDFNYVEIPTTIFHSYINKIWGTSSNDLYIVGNEGNIAHYQNGQLSKVESGTQTIINDIWGITNDKNETIAYCAASSFFTQGDKKVLRIKKDKVDSIAWNMNEQLNGVWTSSSSERYLYVCGGGVFENKKGSWNKAALPSITTNGIRGNGLNDIIVVGDFGLVAHYNGMSWHIYQDIFNAGYGNVAIKGNVVAISGQRNGYGIITIGKRN